MESIGGYRLIAPLGADADGQMWRAQPEGSESPVLVRVLPPT